MNSGKSIELISPHALDIDLSGSLLYKLIFDILILGRRLLLLGGGDKWRCVAAFTVLSSKLLADFIVIYFMFEAKFLRRFSLSVVVVSLLLLLLFILPVVVSFKSRMHLLTLRIG
jgi:hypothetical protein